LHGKLFKMHTVPFKVEERNDPGLKEKVGGYRSFFLNEKEGRKRLPEAVIKALMPTDKEMPKVEKPAEKKEKAEKTATATNKEPAKAPEASTKEVEATPSEPSKNANPGSGGKLYRLEKNLVVKSQD